MGDHVWAMAIKRSRQLKPLSSEHHHALLVAFQLKKGLAGHGDSAGAPKDLPGLVSLARRFEDSTFVTHIRAEEELLIQHLGAEDGRRLQGEHRELVRLLAAAREGRPADARHALVNFAQLLERHVRWEERELFPACESAMGEEALALVGHELEKRLVLHRNEAKPARRP
jgi:hemerythrin-like domain-containing protein